MSRTNPKAHAKSKEPSSKEVDLLQIQDDFEELGRHSPSLTWKEAVKKLAHAKKLVDQHGQPVNPTAKNFLRLCLRAFRRAQREAKQDNPATQKIARTSAKKTA